MHSYRAGLSVFLGFLLGRTATDYFSLVRN